MNTATTQKPYAIFATGGKQYQAVVGDTIAIEKITQEAGEKVTFSEVLLVRADDQTVKIGQPFLASAAVHATVIKHDRSPKVIVYKFKRRKKSRVKRGHRQPFTVIRVENITA